MKDDEPYSCEWCHEPFDLSDRVGFIRFSTMWLSYHKKKPCFDKAQRAARGESITK